jgi:hypothetical protein
VPDGERPVGVRQLVDRTLRALARDLAGRPDPGPALEEFLFQAAGRQHAIRDDVTGTDVILMMCAPHYVTTYVPSPSPDLWRRYLGIILDGLRPQGARPLHAG